MSILHTYVISLPSGHSQIQPVPFPVQQVTRSLLPKQLKVIDNLQVTSSLLLLPTCSGYLSPVMRRSARHKQLLSREKKGSVPGLVLVAAAAAAAAVVVR